MWHLLQVSDALDREFLSALSDLTPAIGWRPRMNLFGLLQSSETEEQLTDPPALIRSFPLQKGYSREPIATLARAGSTQVERMLRIELNPADAPLICTTPYWADAAEEWPGPVIYYLTDLMAAYDGADAALVRRLDRRMCAAASLVCPNSHCIEEYLVAEAGCDPAKIDVVPNATRRINLLPEPPRDPLPLPRDLGDLPRPVVGVIGNLAANMDWTFLAETIERTPEFSWAFVGPFSMQIDDKAQRDARANLMNSAGRVRFTGGKPYGELCRYARAFDAAMLPYFRRQPTLSGSSTRFYEHLAACRPMLATCGFNELLRKRPMLSLVTSPLDAAAQLEQLRTRCFDDGHNELRWSASRTNTWHDRASQMIAALVERTTAPTLAWLDGRVHAEAR